jgi:hypothetical protein
MVLEARALFRHLVAVRANDVDMSVEQDESAGCGLGRDFPEIVRMPDGPSL